MATDHDAERQALSARERREIDRAQVARGDQIDAGGGAAAQHQPAQPDIGPAGRGIAREIHGGGNEGAAVLAVLEVDRKGGQIHVRAGQDHLLHGRLVAADLDEFGLEAQPPEDLGKQLLRGGAKSLREPGSARQRVADEGVAAGRFEQHGFRVGLERARDLAELGRSRPSFSSCAPSPSTKVRSR